MCEKASERGSGFGEESWCGVELDFRRVFGKRGRLGDGYGNRRGRRRSMSIQDPLCIDIGDNCVGVDSEIRDNEEMPTTNGAIWKENVGTKFRR